MDAIKLLADALESLSKRVRKLETMDRYFPGDVYHEPTIVTWFPSSVGWVIDGSYITDCNYMIIGKLVFFRIYVTGTSDSTDSSISLPFQAANVQDWGGACNHATDNGVLLSSPAHWEIETSGLSIMLYTSFDNAVWTDSGTKTILAEGFYQIP